MLAASRSRYTWCPAVGRCRCGSTLTTDETMGEQETRETAATTRSQSVVHYIERNQDDAAHQVSALLERTDDAGGSPAGLVIVPTSDDALSLSEALVARPNSTATLTPVTSPARGKRILTTNPRVIAGSASDLATLVAESRLALSALQWLVVLWPEDIIASDSEALDQVLGEVPKAADRIAISAARTPELAQFLDRAMWRARSFDHAAPGGTSSVAVRVMAAGPRERLRALRTVLDAFDPPTTVLLTFTDAGEAAARSAAATLGATGNLLTVSRGVPDERFSLGVFLDDVPTADALTAAAAITGELVAIIRPARLAAFNKIAAGATPMLWTGALGNARSFHDALREEIRGNAGSGSHLPWVPIIEPLLEALDPVDVAAAALALLDRERRRSKKAAVSVPAAVPVERERESKPDSFKRPPARDDRRPSARDDRRDRPERGGFSRPRDAGGWKAGPRKRDDDARRGPPRDRPARDDRGRGRDDRPRDDSRGRGGRPGEIERVPRAAHEGREWSERGERLKNSRRGPRDGGTAGR